VRVVVLVPRLSAQLIVLLASYARRFVDPVMMVAMIAQRLPPF
jgi:hypothetical protein